MFQARAHRQEGKIVLYSLWYHHTYRCDDTRDEHMCSKHVEAWNKLIIKFSASSWLILINKYIEMHSQQNIKISLWLKVCYKIPSCDTCSPVCSYTGCPRRNLPNFGRVFLMLNPIVLKTENYCVRLAFNRQFIY